MKLSSLTMQGFKSFPERTEILFDDGITAIVGPNGSGKSNVTDAVRWVLGEQSAKTLRGGKMEDVIFDGTEKRRSQNFAEVTLGLSNDDNSLSLPYSEIEITRRYFRSGESEYLINGSQVRLKDVQTLFLDTGIGKDGYSIISQGKVDDILSPRSEDRRKIFDEASGIVKYKQRKLETERKLEQTDLNLLRINDTLSELSLRLEPLELKAEKAKSLIQYRADLREYEVDLLLRQIEASDGDAHKLLEDSVNLESELETNRQTVSTLKTEYDKASADLKKFDSQSGELRELYAQSQLETAHAKHRIDLLNAKIEQNQTHIISIEAEITKVTDELQRLKTDDSGYFQRQSSLEKGKETYETQLKAKEVELATLLSQVNADEQAFHELQECFESLKEETFNLKTKLVEIAHNETVKKNALAEFEQRLQELSSERSRLNFKLEDVVAEIKTERQIISSLETQLSTLTDELNLNKKKLQDAETALSNLKNMRLQVSFQLQTLENLEASHEGYHETVKVLLEACKNDARFGQGVIGPLGELIAVDANHEIAIETALGNTLHNIVTKTRDDATRMVRWLKENKAGRETFLPLDAMRSRKIDASVLAKIVCQQGFVDIASNLIKCDTQIADVISNLLGKVIVFDTIENAVRLTKQFEHGLRIVTLDGDLIHPAGSITGGHQRKGNLSGLLGRARDIARLKKEITRIDTLQTTLTTKLEEADKALIHSSDIHLKTTEEASKKQRNLALLEQSEKTLSGNLEQLTLKINKTTVDMQSLNESFADGATSQTEYNQRLTQIDAKTLALKEELQRHQIQRNASTEQIEELREDVSDLKIALSSVVESLAHIGELKQLEHDKEQELLKHQAISSEKLAVEQATLAEQQAQLAEAQNTEIERHETEKELLAKLQVHEAGRFEIETIISSMFTEINAETAKTSLLEAEQVRIEAKIANCTEHKASLLNQLWESYELTTKMADDIIRHEMSLSSLVREVNRFKQQIKQLGDVDTNVLAELKEVQERHDTIKFQQEDAKATRRELVGLISKLDQSMTEQFATHFEAIKVQFKLVFAELFGGGQADLILDNTTDILEAGIEIKAMPPGKKLQRLSLLSGGERCLTAIALLFSFLKLRPAPFCILDEVESSLDDANVIRFADYVRTYAKNSQFILVTHRKGTMEAADQLYGVTMAQRGISKILSLKLEDA